LSPALDLKTYTMKILNILIFLTFSNLIYSQTINFSGTISQDTDWNYDTVKIIGNVDITSGSTLKIRSGTIIQFQGNFMISSVGRIIAIGEKDKNIVFTINDTTGFSSNNGNVGWAGIKLLYPWDGGNYGYLDTNDSSFFKHCTLEFSRNGALIIENFSKVKISNCNISNNYGSSGAGINTSFSNCLIDSCSFFNNYSYNYGGAIYISDDTYSSPSYYPRITNSFFINNHGSHGGAIDYSGYIYLVGNVFSHNSTYHGGAIQFWGVNGIIANNIICNNTAVYGGGAIMGGGNNSDLLMANNTICNNKAEYAPGIYLDYENYEFINNIVWNNKATRQDSLQVYLFLPGTIINVFNCLIEDYASYNSSTFNMDVNNITGNPSFFNPTDSLIYDPDEIFKNWSLNSGSICIDNGINGYNNYTNFSLPYDISGKNRKCNNTIDIGALEHQTSNTFSEDFNHLNNPIEIFPNPSDGIIYIELNEKRAVYSSFQIKIYNSSGNLVYYNKSVKNMVEKIDISKSKGLNLIEVLSGGNIYTRKVVIK
jgi:predicted outer membrane repeat protein